MKRLCLILFVLLLAAPAMAFDGACQDGEPWQLARMNPAILGGGDSGCAASYGNPISPQNNWTDLGGNETDASTGWTNVGCNTFDGAGTPNTGDYALRATADSADDRFYRYLSNLSTSTLYKVSFNLRHNGTASGTGKWICYLSPTNTNSLKFLEVTKTNTQYTYYYKYFYFSDHQSYFACKESNAENDGGVYLDDFVVTTASPCLGDELFTVADATSLNEENSVTAWTHITAGSGVLESVTTDPQQGNYHLRFLANGANDRFYRDISGILQVGKKYLLSAKVKSASGGFFVCYLGTSHTTNTIIYWTMSAGTNWRHFANDFTYDGSAKYLGCVEATANDNSEVYLDALSIKEIVGE